MIRQTRTIFTLLVIGIGPAWAQNSDLAVLVGGSTEGIKSVTGSTVSSTGSGAFNLQVNYAWQILQRKADLYIELPTVVSIRVNGIALVAPGTVLAAGGASPDVYFTPGLRLKVSPESRVSFFGEAGFGIASFGAISTVVFPSVVSTGSRRNSPAFGFGGGVDIRLTRLLSLRGDVRDFVTESGLGGAAGRNHTVFQAGIAFHF